MQAELLKQNLAELNKINCAYDSDKVGICY